MISLDANLHPTHDVTIAESGKKIGGTTALPTFGDLLRCCRKGRWVVGHEDWRPKCVRVTYFLFANLV